MRMVLKELVERRYHDVEIRHVVDPKSRVERRFWDDVIDMKWKRITLSICRT